MTLNMIRARLDYRALHEWMQEKDLSDQDHGMHCLLGETFGSLAPRVFRTIGPRTGNIGTLYGYCQAAAEELLETARATADPVNLEIIQEGSLTGKSMDLNWKEGQQLNFELRARPVARVPRPDGRRYREIDFYQPGNGFQNREEAYAHWLGKQLDRKGAARLDRVQVPVCRQVRSCRNRHGRPVEGPDVIFNGALTVLDTGKFQAALAHGIGRHKAYGYGMLLLKPPGHRR